VNPYEEVARYLHSVLDGDQAPSEQIPYWSLLAVVMDRRMADVHEERDAETIDTLEVADVQRMGDGLRLHLRASTFIGLWYPVSIDLRPTGESTLWFGAPDLAVSRKDVGRLTWPDSEDEWPAVHNFDLSAFAEGAS